MPEAHKVTVNKQCRQAAPYVLAAVVGLNLILLTSAQAKERLNASSAQGELHVYGELTESACRLDMSSAYQDIMLGSVATGSLQMPGDKGTPVAAHLFLRDCLPEHTRAPDLRTGQVLWSGHQPVVTVAFSAPSDPDSSDLVRVAGASGLALKLTDERGRDVRLGSSGAPLFLNVGQNELTYWITPVRTKAPLNAGAFRAQINFGLSYD